jgi:peroxiredoxin
MPAVNSTMLPLGTAAPNFSLPDTVSGRNVSMSQFSNAPALVVIFMCNHCPFVKHIAAALAQFGRDMQTRKVAVVGISSNDVAIATGDTPHAMTQMAKENGYTFPYLFDETQAVAKAYKAACTPDFFLFDKNMKLVYRGQFDDSRPSSAVPVTGKDLRAAVDAVLAGKPVATQQKPSMGCGIKWRKGSAPEYFKALT